MTTLTFEKHNNDFISSVVSAGTAASLTAHFNFTEADRTNSNLVTIQGTIDENLGWSNLDNADCSDCAEITLNNIPSSQSIRFVCDKEPVSAGYEINS